MTYIIASKKDMVNFWKSWNSKMVKPKQAAFIDGEYDGPTIAQKFGTHFQVSSNLTTDYIHHNNNNTDALSELHRVGRLHKPQFM